MRKSLILSLSALALLLTGCSGYNPTPLEEPVLTREEILASGVNAYYRCLSPKESRAALGKRFPSKTVTPIQLILSNNTSTTYEFSVEELSLPFISREVIEKKVRSSTLGRAFVIGGYSCALIAATPTILISPPALVGTFFWAGVCTINSYKGNERLIVDYDKKVRPEFVLKPYGQESTVIFVDKKDFRPNFCLALIEKDRDTSLLVKAFPLKENKNTK